MILILIFAVLVGFNLVAVVVNTVADRRQHTLQVDVVDTDVDAMFSAAPTATDGPSSNIDWRSSTADWRPSSGGPRLALNPTAGP